MEVTNVSSSIFLPLTFMQELEWPDGYVACLVVMGLTSLTKVLWFHRQGWFQDWTGMR